MARNRSKPSPREPHGDADWPQERLWPDPALVHQEIVVPPRRVRRRAAARARRRGRRWWIAPLILAGLALLVLGGAGWVEWRFRGRIFPHVYVAGVDVGDLTPEEATTLLRLRHQAFQDHPLTLIYQDRVWRPAGVELGVQVAWDEAASEAMAVGRGGSLWQRWWERWQVSSSRRDLLLPVWLDEGILHSYLDNLAREIDAPPADAALAVEGQQVAIRPGRPGRQLEVLPTLLAVRRGITQLSVEPVPLQVNVTSPVIDEEAVQDALTMAQAMVSAPILLRFEGQTWTLSPEQIAQMILVERRQLGDREILAVVLDQEALRDLVEEIAEELYVRPRNAHVRFVDDRLQVVDEGASGRELAVETVVDRIDGAVLSSDRTIDLIVREVLPEIRPETIEELGIREVVGMGESSFSGSQSYRVHNISNAARILDGTLIAPGEPFSFIQTIGPIDESDGFVEGYSIVGGRTVLNVGGGVCQVSTTVFRAAFYAGLPFIERHAHAFRLGFYEQGSPIGMDATIFASTGTDLQFRNDTDGYLLMQFEVYTHTGILRVFLYGTRPNREVQLDGPHLSNWTPAPTEPVYVDNPNLPQGVIRQTDWARDGVDVTIYRHILVDGEVVSTDTFFSRYEAWPNVYEVGTGPP